MSCTVRCSDQDPGGALRGGSLLLPGGLRASGTREGAGRAGSKKERLGVQGAAQAEGQLGACACTPLFLSSPVYSFIHPKKTSRTLLRARHCPSRGGRAVRTLLSEPCGSRIANKHHESSSRGRTKCRGVWDRPEAGRVSECGLGPGDKRSAGKWDREDGRSDKKWFKHEVPGAERTWLLQDT